MKKKYTVVTYVRAFEVLAEEVGEVKDLDTYTDVLETERYDTKAEADVHINMIEKMYPDKSVIAIIEEV